MVSEPYMEAIAAGGSREERRQVVFYWSFTGLLILLLAVQAILLILGVPPMRALVQHLGYPAYFPLFLGIAKLLAVIAIAQPWSGRLKEWAYAGVTFDLVAAAVSHIASHDSAREVAGPIMILIIVAVSYVAYVGLKRQSSIPFRNA